MTDIMKTDPSDILENFQTAYAAKFGKRMQIGSEEYALSSAFAYTLSHYAALVNQSYQNQNIDTASGEFLDALGMRYGLTRKGETFSKPWFELGAWFNKQSEFYKKTVKAGQLTVTVQGHTFTNLEESTDGISINTRMQTKDDIDNAISWTEIHEALVDAKDNKGNPLFDFESSWVTDLLWHVSDLFSASYEMNDDEFRAYINSNKDRYNRGIAGAFESVARAAFKDIVLDARVRVQGDDGFIAGNVDLFVKGNELNWWNLFQPQYLDEITKAIETANIAVVGQTVNVATAKKVWDTRSYNFYIPKAYDTDEYRDLYESKVKAARDYLNSRVLGIGDAYTPSMLVNIAMKDLSTLSTNLLDFGIMRRLQNVEEFEKFASLPILGLAYVSNTGLKESAPDSYIEVSIAKMQFIAI